MTEFDSISELFELVPELKTGSSYRVLINSKNMATFFKWDKPWFFASVEGTVVVVTYIMDPPQSVKFEILYFRRYMQRLLMDDCIMRSLFQHALRIYNGEEPKRP